MANSAYKNLNFLRIDGDCRITPTFEEEYNKRFSKKHDHNVAGAVTQKHGRQNFGFFLHTCLLGGAKKQNKKFHFLYQIDKLKLGDSVKENDAKLFEKIDTLLLHYDFNYKCKARVIFQYSLKKYNNLFEFPQKIKYGKLKVKQKGSIFVFEDDPNSGYFCEVTKTHFVIAKQFKLIKFKYQQQAIDRIITQIAEEMSNFVKEN